MLELSFDQNKALFQITKWYQNKEKLFITLGGYAGTGKTTLISILRNELNEKYPDLAVAFCSYTGKAARVLQRKLKVGYARAARIFDQLEEAGIVVDERN